MSRRRSDALLAILLAGSAGSPALPADPVAERIAYETAVEELRDAFDLPEALVAPPTSASDMTRILIGLLSSREQDGGNFLTRLGLYRAGLAEQLDRLARGRPVDAPPPAEPDLLLFPAKIERAGQPTLGPADAAITVDLVTDFTCGIAKAEERQLEALLAEFRDRVRFVAHHFALGPAGSEPFERVRAARCAHEQAGYWEFRRILYDPRAASFDRTGRALLERLAETAGLDLATFQTCLDSERSLLATLREQERLARIGAVGVPAALIDRRFLLFSGKTPTGLRYLLKQRLSEPKAAIGVSEEDRTARTKSGAAVEGRNWAGSPLARPERKK